MATTRPNIVVIMADDHRGTELGHLPDSSVRTPVLDALAARGVSIAGAHCQGGMIPAVCVPSRASLMTGRNIFTSSENPSGSDFLVSMKIPHHLETFPQALRASGYHTHAIGKWHNDTASFHRSFSSGEALMFLGMSDHWQVPTWSFSESGTYVDPDAFDFGSLPSADTEPASGGITIRNEFSSDIFANAAIDFIDGYADSDPFMLYVAFTSPHDPRTPPPEWVVDPASIELPPNYMPEHPFDNGDLKIRDEMLGEFPRTEQEVRQHLADYYGMIQHLDYSIGRIVDAIESAGLTENTIVIYTGDHGLAIGQHGLMGKQNVYQHSLRMPLILAGPGIAASCISDALVWHGDTTATIRSLAGVEPDPAAEGVSYIDASGSVIAHREHLGAAYEYGQRAFRGRRYKLIEYCRIPENAPRAGTSPGSDVVQLFDLEADPWELDNLADDSAHRDIRANLEVGLRQWQVDVGDQLLLLA